jgi:glycogen phosphorylase
MDKGLTRLLRPLPQGLEPLAELALDLRWTWSHASDELWQALDSELWELTQNPWVMLQSVSRARLEHLATDSRFTAALAHVVAAHQDYLSQPSWFRQTYPADALHPVAYFSMEFGVGEALPLYAGGLGVLAGDYLKTASDLDVPLVGVGLLYQEGYFRQILDSFGWQVEAYPFNDPASLPIRPALDADGEWLRVSLELPGRALRLRVWQVQVGRIRLYLLDSNDPLNSAADRGVTAKLYDAGLDIRLLQEMDGVLRDGPLAGHLGNASRGHRSPLRPRAMGVSRAGAASLGPCRPPLPGAAAAAARCRSPGRPDRTPGAGSQRANAGLCPTFYRL